MMGYDSIPGHSISLKDWIALVFTRVFGSQTCHFPDRSLLIQEDDDFCGTHALVNLGWHFGLWHTFTYEQLAQWHSALTLEEKHRGEGANDYATAHAWLVNFLPSRGVPATLAADRASQALKKLGIRPILKAIDHENPWRHLKSIGSNASKPFQWVTADELREHIALKAQSDFGADGRKKPGKPRHKKESVRPHPLVLSPEVLKIPEQAFQDANGAAVPVLEAAAVQADCRGVAIITMEQAQRFLQDSRSISTDALGALTTTVIEHPTATGVSNLTWPALFGGEPLLVKGSLIQLGDIIVQLKTGAAVKSSSMITGLLRLQLYQDQSPVEWVHFVKSPLRQLVNAFQPLQICQKGAGATSCSATCLRFHPPVDEPCEVVLLDCFAWRWHGASGGSSTPVSAASFSVMVRTPLAAVEAILGLSGRDGFYTELREDSAAPPKYGTIWLKADFAEAEHLMRTQQHALHLIRSYSRYGLRCLKKHELDLRKELFPETPFIDCEVKMIYQAGPWHYGETKANIQAALTTLPWNAKVLKPGRGGPDGRFWIIGASQASPVPVFPYGGSLITISLLKDTKEPKQTNNVVASLKTMQKLQEHTQHPVPVDPWLQKDPWSRWQTTTPASSASAAGPNPSRLEALEQKLTDTLQQKIQESLAQQPNVSTDVDMDRLATVESDLHEVKLQQERFSGWFQEIGDKMQQLSGVVTEHGTSIEALQGSVSQQAQYTQHLQQQMAAMENTLRVEVREAAASSVDRIESLLAKRHKSTE